MTDFENSLPGERTVYIETDPSVNNDGIPNAALLVSVRAYITIDQITGFANQPLGLTDETLFVEPIRRTAIFLRVNGLAIPTAQEASAKVEIDEEVDFHLRRLRPFVQGADVEIDRNDIITALSMSISVQSVLLARGGTATTIAFGVEEGSFLDSYTLSPGELVKLGNVTYG